MPRNHALPDGEDVPEPRDRTVRLGDQVIVYEATGTLGGPDFVLVHGIGMGHTVFRGLARELGTVGRVFALDLPGFGESPEPSTPRSMAESGDLIVAFVEQLGIDEPVLVGHSMGTQVVAGQWRGIRPSPTASS
ncbi:MULTISPECIES: alpha/beta fold hydrolase [unclassified Microbacterium]|uniref:alpha/beta fold hydrolase n=1 Tax=unclassified Microbacterium TaxID=2609290 RepID=UPI0011AF5A92|nr:MULTISPECIES: alpha/beta fold hydrolase [unclassified Microbacterium]